MRNVEENSRINKASMIITPTYRGPDRRRSDQSQDDVEVYQTVVASKVGEVILDVRTNARRRREDDMTVNLLKCLDISALSLEDSDD